MAGCEGAAQANLNTGGGLGDWPEGGPVGLTVPQLKEEECYHT